MHASAAHQSGKCLLGLTTASPKIEEADSPVRCRVLQVGSAVAYYVLVAIYISQHIGERINKSHVPWPDWAWYFVVGAGFLWLLASILALSTPPHTLFSLPFMVFQLCCYSPGACAV